MNLPSIFAGKRRNLFGQLFANALAQAAILYVNAMLIRYAFDHFIARIPVQNQMIWFGLAMLLSAFATGWLHRKERITAENLGQSYVHNLRIRLFRHISRMDSRLLQKHRRGSVMLKFVGDLNAVRRWVSFGIVRIVMSGAIILSTLTVLLLIDWTLSMVAAILIASGIFCNIRIGESLRAAAGETRKRRSRLSANINEKLAQMSVVQVFGRRDSEIKRVRRHSVYLRRAMVGRAAKIGSIRGITHCGAALAVTAVLLTGIFQVSSGQTTPGTVAAAMVVIGFLVPALKNLGRVYEYHQDALVARQKLTRFLQIKSRIKLGAKLPQLPAGPGRLTLKNVTVKGVFKNVSAEALPGQVVAVIGPNGAGKSVLIELIARLVSPAKGRVMIDGHNISRFNLKSIRRLIGIVSPDLPLLSGSLEMNLRYRSPKINAEAFQKIKKLCGIDELISQLPRGERTRILEGGRNLSTGQRQRVLLARALMGNPRILLLDEVDAHLDDRARRALNDVIRTFEGTVLWVTHQQEPLVGVDAIWRIEKGNVHIQPIRHLSQRQRAAV